MSRPLCNNCDQGIEPCTYWALADPEEDGYAYWSRCPGPPRSHAESVRGLERWADVPGHPGYQASSHGRIRSEKRGILTGTPQKGYTYVHIIVNGRRMHVAAHKMVMLAFVGPAPESMEVRHLNGNPSDNRLVNLAWGTHAENNQDRVRHGTHQKTAQTHCVNGHPFDVENTYFRKDVISRQCRACTRSRRLARAAEARLERIDELERRGK